MNHTSPDRRCVMTRPLPRLLAVVLLCLLGLATLAGCSSRGGQLAITSQNIRGSELTGKFTTGLYRYDDRNQLTMLLVDGPIEAPAQAVTIRMFWSPRPGRTPIDPTATNATIHYIIFAGENRQEVGIYSGAGFLFPKGKPGSDTFTAQIWQSTLRLTDATDQFQDLLGPSNLKGQVTLKHDDIALEKALRDLNIQLRETMGFPRLVDATIR